MNPVCECGAELIPIDENCWACMYCDLPQEDMEYIYTSVCWSCGNDIDSRTCHKSIVPGMGYYCKHCGKDLTEWKLKRRMLYENSIKQQGVYACRDISSPDYFRNYDGNRSS